jgi:hypothetical protein
MRRSGKVLPRTRNAIALKFVKSERVAKKKADREAKRQEMLARRPPSTPIRFEDLGGPDTTPIRK